MKKILNLTTIASALLAPTLVQAQATSPMEVSVTVEPGCFITADNLNFGVLQMPLQQQQTQGNIQVKCSNNTPLRLDLSYSENIRQNNNGEYSYSVITTNNNGTWYTISKNNIPLENVLDAKYTTSFGCAKNGGTSESGGAADGKVFFYSSSAMKLYGVTGVPLKTYVYDQWNICQNNTINTTTFNNVTGGSSVGVLTGVAKGEQIKFVIKNPQKSNSDWGQGTNGYSMTANGDTQNLVITAQISSDNPTHRLSPDNYQSSITLVLNY